MVTDSSPVKDYYPVDFETDLNGKLQEWEAVVLIPFIDEVDPFIAVFMMIVVFLTALIVIEFVFNYCKLVNGNMVNSSGMNMSSYWSGWLFYCYILLIRLVNL